MQKALASGGIAPDPDGGAYSAPPYPLAGREGVPPLPHPPQGGGGTTVDGRCTLYSLPTPQCYILPQSTGTLWVCPNWQL